MSTARVLLALPLVALLLTSCGVDPAAERRELVLGITESANDGDEDGVRAQADSLLQLVERQVADEEIPAEEAERLRALAEKVMAGADVLDEELQAQLKAKAEAEAERAQQERDEAERLLEEERRNSEEDGRGKGEGKGDKDDD